MQWALPGLDIMGGDLEAFDFEGGWGVLRRHSTVQVATTPGSAELKTV